MGSLIKGYEANSILKWNFSRKVALNRGCVVPSENYYNSLQEKRIIGPTAIRIPR